MTCMPLFQLFPHNYDFDFACDSCG